MRLKILLFAGTTEGRLIAEHMAEKDILLDVSVATEYAANLLPAASNIRIFTNRLDAGQIQELLNSEGYSLVLDATHPYAEEVSRNIQTACQAERVRCMRILRESEIPYPGDHVRFATDLDQAIRYLRRKRGPIFLTTGSKTLPRFMEIPNAKERIFARILPVPGMLEEILSLGLPGSHIICAQGPFSTESNLAALKSVQSRWGQEHPNFAHAPITMVSKESGQKGGFPEKMEAAKQAGANVLVLCRPEETTADPDCLSLTQATAMLDSVCGPISNGSPREVFLIGCGMSASQLTLEADAAIRSCDLLIGANRLLEMTAHYGKKTFCSYDYPQVTDYLLANPQIRKAAVLFSGDIGLYSGAARLRECLAPHADTFCIRPLPGISSPVHFLDLLGKSYEDVRILSLHGQSTPVSTHLRTQGKLLVLLGKKDDVPQICQNLLAQGMGDARLTVGSCLHSPQESIVSGSPADLAGREFPPLSVLYLEYDRAVQEPVTHGLADEAFTRGEVPMTKSEIRSVILSKLGLTRNAVFFDIGAGTGSIAVEAARMIPESQVYAIERKEEALSLIRENAVKLQADHLQVIAGAAPEALAQLPAPTHAFIGGSGGRIREILQTLLEKNPQVKMVASAITLETLAELQKATKELALPEPEIVQIQVSRIKKAGSSHLMQAQNPVFLVTFAPAHT